MLLISSRDKEIEIRVNAKKFPWKGFASGEMEQNPKITEWMKKGGGKAKSREGDSRAGKREERVTSKRIIQNLDCRKMMDDLHILNFF